MKKENYKVTKNTINQIYEFARLYERLYLVPSGHKWFERLREISRNKSAFAAMSMDKSKYSRVNFLDENFKVEYFFSEEEVKLFENYTEALSIVPEIFDPEKDYEMEMLETAHKKILGAGHEDRFRKEDRVLTKLVIENNVRKEVPLKVRTRPEQIISKLRQLVDWLDENEHEDNPLIVAGLAHMKLIEIHPFADGNGRLAWILDNGVLFRSGFDYYNLLSIEDYYLQNFERYYGLIEQTIATGDHTEWLEFYTAGLLESINASVNVLRELSGGSVDLVHHKVADLTEKEVEIIDILVAKGQASGAEIAKVMGVTRQTINVMLQRLREKDLVIKVGKAGGSRFKVKG